MYVCRRCGYTQETPWPSFCPGCNGPYRSKKQRSEASARKEWPTFVNAVEIKRDYIPTGIAGIDYVLSGGLVAGSAWLIGGFRGTGKTRLLTALADSISKRRKVAYASSEMTTEALQIIAGELGLHSDNVALMGLQRNIDQTLDDVRSMRAFVGIYDSFNRYTTARGLGPGHVAKAIVEHCQDTKSCAIIVNQMTQGGEIKGGTDAEHEVDAVAYLAYPKDDDEEAPTEPGVRVLAMDKNRNGTENLRSYWRMTSAGVLEEVPKRSKLAEHAGEEGGSNRGKYEEIAKMARSKFGRG